MFAKRILSKWIILRDAEDMHHHFYVGEHDNDESYEDTLRNAGFDDSEFEDMEPVTTFTPDDVAEVLDNWLEDENRHSLCGLFDNLLDELNKCKTEIPDNEKIQILSGVCNSLT